MAAEAKHGKQRAAIRALRREDAPAVTKILQEAPEAARWAEKSFVESLNWAGVVALITENDGRVMGFIVGRQAADEAEILNLAVTPAERRKGQGGALLKSALEEFQSRGVRRVYLEVRESNVTAITFYAKHGFCKEGRRGGYYREPDEAGVEMERKLTV